MKNAAAVKKETGSYPILSLSENSVILHKNNVITIRDLSFRSQDVHSFLEQAPKPAEALVGVIETGVAVLRRAESSLDTDFVQKKLNEQFTGLEKNIDTHIDKTAGSLNNLLSLKSKHLKELLDQGMNNILTLDQKVNQFSDVLKDQLGKEVTKMADPNNSPIGILLGQIKTEIESFRDLLFQKKVESVTSSSVVGKNFEEKVTQKIEEIAKNMGIGGISITDCRNVNGISQNKKGDFIIQFHNLKTEPKVTLEVKDQRSNTVPYILKSLDGSIVNREAIFGIFISANQEDLPNSIGDFNFFGNDKIVTAYNFIEIAFKLCVSKLMATEAAGTEVDMEKVLGIINQIESSIKKFTALKAACRSTIKGAQKSETLASEVEGEIQEATNTLIHMLTTKDAEK